MKQLWNRDSDYLLPILRDPPSAACIFQVPVRQLTSITAFLYGPSAIFIDMTGLRTIRTSDASTDHRFLVGSIEV